MLERMTRDVCAPLAVHFLPEKTRVWSDVICNELSAIGIKLLVQHVKSPFEGRMEGRNFMLELIWTVLFDFSLANGCGGMLSSMVRGVEKMMNEKNSNENGSIDNVENNVNTIDFVSAANFNLQNVGCSVQDLIMDAIGVVWEELGLLGQLEGVEEMKRNLVAFVVLIRKMDVISLQKTQESLQGELLELIGDVSNFKKVIGDQMVRKKTTNRLTQAKCNLYREESEGFAKLLTILYSSLQSTIFDARILENISAVIGCYRIDPNRVLDVVIDVFQFYPLHPSFLPIINMFVASHLGPMLFTRLNPAFASNSMNRTFGAPNDGLQLITLVPTIHVMLSVLIKANKASLDDVYEQLAPTEEQMVLAQKNYNEARLNFRQNADENVQEYPSFSFIIAPNLTNHKLDFLAAFIPENWDLAVAILNRLQRLGLIVTDYPSITTSLGVLVSKMVLPYYELIAYRWRAFSPAFEFESLNLEGAVLNLFVDLFSRPGMAISSQQLQAYCLIHFLYESLLPVLVHLGAQLHKDIMLMTKICRICAFSLRISKELKVLTVDETKYIESVISDLLCVSILPAYSLSPGFPAISGEVWEILKHLSYESRFSVYGYWQSITYHSSLKLAAVKEEAIKKAKHFQKRLAKDNVKQMRRQLVRFALNNSLIVNEVFFLQLLNFDNLIGCFIDVYRPLSPLVWDTVVYTFLNILATRKFPLEEGGSNTKKWFQNLTKLIGSFVCRYSDSDFEFSPILFYILNQLKVDDPIPLLIFKEIIIQASGIETTEEVSDAQLAGQSGGPALRSATAAFSESRNLRQKVAAALYICLQRNNIVFEFIRLIAAQREKFVYNCDANYHLRGISTIYDEIQDTLITFVEFLAVKTPNLEEYREFLPSLEEMLSKYALPIDVAFLLMRPLLGFDNLQSAETDSISKVVSNLIPNYVGITLGSDFYLTFWRLSVSDLSVPIEFYQKLRKDQLEAIKLQLVLEQRGDSKDANFKDANSKDLLFEQQNVLERELKRQESNLAIVRAKLENAKGSWFANDNLIPKSIFEESGTFAESSSEFVKKCSVPSILASLSEFSALKQRVYVLLQHCILPRCLISAIDSVYAAKFIEFLIDHDVPGFSFVDFLLVLTKSVSSLIVSVTLNEASRLGRFFREILKILHKWANKSAFESKGSKLWAFAVGAVKADTASWFIDCRCCLSYLTLNCVQSLRSNSDVEKRNMLKLLAKLADTYPRLQMHGQAIETEVTKVKDSAPKSSDLKLLATQVLKMLLDNKTHLVSEAILFGNALAPQKIEKSTPPIVTVAQPIAPSAMDVKQLPAAEKAVQKSVENVVEKAAPKPTENAVENTEAGKQSTREKNVTKKAPPKPVVPTPNSVKEVKESPSKIETKLEDKKGADSAKRPENDPKNRNQRKDPPPAASKNMSTKEPASATKESKDPISFSSKNTPAVKEAAVNPNNAEQVKSKLVAVNNSPKTSDAAVKNTEKSNPAASEQSETPQAFGKTVEVALNGDVQDNQPAKSTASIVARISIVEKAVISDSQLNVDLKQQSFPSIQAVQPAIDVRSGKKRPLEEDVVRKDADVLEKKSRLNSQPLVPNQAPVRREDQSSSREKNVNVSGSKRDDDHISANTRNRGPQVVRSSNSTPSPHSTLAYNSTQHRDYSSQGSHDHHGNYDHGRQDSHRDFTRDDRGRNSGFDDRDYRPPTQDNRRDDYRGRGGAHHNRGDFRQK